LTIGSLSFGAGLRDAGADDASRLAGADNAYLLALLGITVHEGIVTSAIGNGRQRPQGIRPAQNGRLHPRPTLQLFQR
jgi:hypothetical protein